MATRDYYIYDVIEAVRQYSDDSDISVEHVGFMIDTTRALLLRQKYANPGSIIPQRIRQRLHFTLELASENDLYDLDYNLRTINALPKLIENSSFVQALIVDGGSYYDYRFIYTSPERFRYVGNDKYLNNIIYVTLGQDYRLLFKSNIDKHKFLEKVRVFGIFEDPQAAWEASADYDADKDFNTEVDYPMDLDMWVQVKEIIVKQLLMAMQVPQDKNNNASED